MSSLIPHFTFHSLLDISPDFIAGQGILFVMLDLDNTVAAYNEPTPSRAVLNWCESIRAKGITLFLISNSMRSKRVVSFSQALGISYAMKAGKPSPKALLAAMSKLGYGADVSALIGDQIFTDTLAARRAGILSIIVKPKRFTNPFLALRYCLELPLRHIGIKAAKKGDFHEQYK